MKDQYCESSRSGHTTNLQPSRSPADGLALAEETTVKEMLVAVDKMFSYTHLRLHV